MHLNRPLPGAARRANFGANLTGSATTPTPANNINNTSPSKGKARAPSPQSQSKQQTPQPPAQAPSTTAKAVTKDGDNAEEEEEEEDCFLCASEGLIWALPECGHKTCHVCSMRMRALFKNFDCTFCKTPCPDILFASSPSALFTTSTEFNDAKLGLHFQTSDQMKTSLSLLHFNCPSPNCSVKNLLGWSDLKRHVKRVHGQTLCDLCLTGKKIFPGEHALYLPNGPTKSEGVTLKAHMEDLHFKCAFCQTWYFEEAELWKHCREQHEECFLCKKSGIAHQYFLNWEKVEAHYSSAHYMCPAPQCIEQKFVVFASELDLQAHSVEVHNTALGDQRSRKDARRIDTNFSIESSASSSRNGQSDARRMEMYDQGTTFIGAGGNGVRGGSNGNAGGSGSNAAASGKGRSRAPTPDRAATPTTAGGATDETVSKHAALKARVSDLVGGNERKLALFRFSVRGYRASELTGQQMCERLLQILEDVPKVGPILNSLIELLEDKEKQDELAKAWRNFKPPVAQNTQFPSLAPLGPTLLTPLPPPPPRQPSRPFPPLPSSSASNRGFAPISSRSNFNPNATPWTSSSTPTSFAPSPAASPRPTPALAPRPIARPPATHEFPSLPVSQGELDRRARMNAALGRPSSSTSSGASATGSWGEAANSGGNESGMSGGGGGGGGGGGRGRRNRGRVLMTQGGVRRGD